MAICGKYDFPVSKIDGDRLVDAVEENGYGTNEYGSDPSFPLSECLPLLSIGQCIELLQEKKWIHEIFAPETEELNEGDLTHKDDDEWWYQGRKSSNPYNWQVYTTSVGFYNTKELIDGLWEAVKQVI